MFKIEQASSFKKQSKKFFLKHIELFSKFELISQKLAIDPFDPTLKTHKLSGKLDGLYACSLSHEYRILLTIEIKDDIVTLIAIGSHDEIY